MRKCLYHPAGIGALTLLLILLDQLTKYLAVRFLKNQAPFVIWDGVFELRYLENRGAAFGMLQGQRLFFLLVGVLVFAAALYFFRYGSEDKKFWPLRLIAVFILAGALGNMLDRMVNAYVVDFFYFKLIDFAIFNVADIYVSVGTATFMALLLFYYKDEDLDRVLEKRRRKL